MRARVTSINLHAVIDFTSLKGSIALRLASRLLFREPRLARIPQGGAGPAATPLLTTLVNQMKLNLPVLLMIGALAVPAAAQIPAPTSTSGVVVSSTTESLVVRLDDGTERTFNVTSTTALPSAPLAEGNRVTVQYRPLDAGLFEAARVELVAAVNPDRPVANLTPDRSMTSEPAAIQGGVTPTQRDTTEDRETLPSTASPMPLLALSGIAALISGLLLKARRTA